MHFTTDVPVDSCTYRSCVDAGIAEWEQMDGEGRLERCI